MTPTNETTRREFLTRLAGVGALLSRPDRLLAGEASAGRPAREMSSGSPARQVSSESPTREPSSGSPASGASARGVLQETLPTREIPVSGERLPVVGFGSTKAVLEIPEEGTEPIDRIVRVLLEHGGRVVDTSPRTPEIDERFARVLHQPDLGNRLFVATKINTPDEETGVEQFRQNQRTVGRKTLDLVQVESLRGLEDHWPHLVERKGSGEARYIGATVSRYQNHDRLERFMRRESPDFVHMNYSVMEPRAEERLLPLARDRGMAVVVNRPFMNGEWFGMVRGRELPEWAAEIDCRTWAQFSLKYILEHPAVTCVLTETTNPEHMEENIEAAFGRLPDEAMKRRMREHVEGWT